MKNYQKIAKERQLVNDSIRGFFNARLFIEVETPLVVRSPGMEPNLFPFETSVIEPDGATHPAGLITSPEYACKKLLGAGMQKIYTITKVFRNREELGGNHNPEFSMLEWYLQGKGYEACMDETEALVQHCAKVFGKEYPAFKRFRVRDILLEKTGVDLDYASVQDLKDACERLQIHTDETDTESDLFYRLFLEKVEEDLGDDPVFIYDYPKHQASLARLTDDGRYGKRFELYIEGKELCNAFEELTDEAEQRSRFKEEALEREELGKTVFPIDEELLTLLPSMKNPSYGNALGIDRLHMVLSGAASIKDVLLFPAADLFKKTH
jgi:elongation factor P--(R)-beta-lysine ligase